MKRKTVKKNLDVRKKYSTKTMTFEERVRWVSEKYFYEVNHLVSEAHSNERLSIQNDPGTRILGSSIADIKHAMNLVEADGKAGAYKKGFGDALGTIKRVAEQEIARLSS